MKLRNLKLYSFSLFVVLISMLPVVDSLAAKNPTTPSSPSPSNGATNVAVSGTLFQMYNLDMPTIIEDVKTEDDKTTVQFKDRLMKVEGAQANATICVFSINGELVVKTKANEQGCATVQLSSVPDGLYVFTISNGKSGKILVK